MKVDIKKKKIGIALSGGGIRATIYHLGVLKWLAEERLMENVRYISSVSGGSLCAGLVYAWSDGKWPSSRQYLDKTLPAIEKAVMGSDIQISALLRVFPFWLNRKVNLLAKVIGKKWGISGAMSDLSRNPIWCANCTTYETGKRFGITQEMMGDIVVGHVRGHGLPISDAMAASSGFPVLIGPYALQRDKYTWEPISFEPKTLHNDSPIPGGRHFYLWDGGVYDNLGLEAFFHISDSPGCGHFSGGIDYVIVSNARVAGKFKRRAFSLRSRRLLDIAMEQVGTLRVRTIMSHMRQHKSGLHLQIGDSTARILRNIEPAYREQIVEESLTEKQARYVKNYSTTLRRPSQADFEMILRHGYEVAKYQYLATSYVGS